MLWASRIMPVVFTKKQPHIKEIKTTFYNESIKIGTYKNIT
tara:strand:+ start:623 stop:745 length:123 start_codon:yes stop_codon:yes gene_type:complete